MDSNPTGPVTQPEKHSYTKHYLLIGALAVVAVVIAVILAMSYKTSNLGAQVFPFGPSSTTVSKNPTVACKTTTPSVRVLSPNGGQVYQPGQQVAVTWSSCNHRVNEVVSINLNGPLVPGIGTRILVTTTNDGSETVTLPTGAQYPSMQFGNVYKMQVIVGDQQDMSDTSFAINNPSSGGPSVGPSNNPSGGPSVGPDNTTNGPSAGGSSTGPVSAGCNAQTKLILIPEETSSDAIIASQTGSNQEIARFWLYSPCNIKIGGLRTQAFGPYSVPNGQGQNTGYTFWGANRFSQFSAHNGFTTSAPTLGTVSYAGIGADSSITFTSPLQLQAGVPKAISISGKLKPVSQVSGTVLNRAQFCIETPSNVTDMNGSPIQIQQPLNSNGTSGNFFGRFTCGDVFSIN